MLTFKNTKSWVLTLTVAGGGWRLPTESELDFLYSSGVLMIDRCTCCKDSYATKTVRAYIDPIFGLTCASVFGIDPGNSPPVEGILYYFKLNLLSAKSDWFSPGSLDEIPFTAFAVRKQMKNN